MSANHTTDTNNGPIDRFLVYIEKARQLHWFSQALISPFYLLAIGFIGNRMTKEQLLMIGTFWFAIVAGLLFIVKQAVRPSVMEPRVLLPKGVPAPVRKRGIKPLLAYIRVRYLLFAIIYVVGSSAGFFFWYDREFRNEPPLIDLLSAEATQLALSHQTKVTVLANDPEQGALDYEWSATQGNISSASIDNSSIIYTTPGVTGQQEISVIVTDNKGKQTKGRIRIDVR